MKENELTIEIPNDKIVDWEESKKQNKLVLKNKQLSYEDVCKKLFNRGLFYVGADGAVEVAQRSTETSNYLCDENNATTKHQLECILAKNKLANVAIYLNDGWKPTYTSEGHYDAWILFTTPKKDYIGEVKISNCCYNSNVIFKSKELAQQAIEILGEETVKLALEPLGI